MEKKNSNVRVYAKEGEESDSGEVIGVEELVIGRAIAASAAAKVKTQTLFEAGTTRSFSFWQLGVFVTHGDGDGDGDGDGELDDKMVD